MFQFTKVNEYGTRDYVDAPSLDVRDTVANGSDVAFLPILIAAANVANERDLCSVYDDIAQAIGGPTRSQLAELGLVKARYTVQVTRHVPVTVNVRQTVSTTVMAFGAEDAREQVDNGLVEDLTFGDGVDGFSVRDSVNRYETYDIDDRDEDEDDEEVTVEYYGTR